MKKNALVVFGMVAVLAGGAVAQTVGTQVNTNSSVVKKSQITVDDARKIALKKTAGTVEEEYQVEDEKGKLEAYAFRIRQANKKIMEVQVDAKNGKIIYAEIEED